MGKIVIDRFGLVEWISPSSGQAPALDIDIELLAMTELCEDMERSIAAIRTLSGRDPRTTLPDVELFSFRQRIERRLAG